MRTMFSYLNSQLSIKQKELSTKTLRIFRLSPLYTSKHSFPENLHFPGKILTIQQVSMDSLKMEKAKAMERFNNRTMRNFMLLFELCLGLVMASWVLTCVFTWLPVAVKFSSDHLGGNLSAFLFCNVVIVLVLFLSSINNPDSVSSRPDLLDQFVAASRARRSSPTPVDKHVLVENRILDSGSVSVSQFDQGLEKTERALAPKTEKTEETEKTEFSVSVPAVNKVFERTQSDNAVVERKKEKQLRRSETGPRRKEAVEELSNEEFRLKIESFIAAQKCNLMKEHKCTDIVLRD